MLKSLSARLFVGLILSTSLIACSASERGFTPSTPSAIALEAGAGRLPAPQAISSAASSVASKNVAIASPQVVCPPGPTCPTLAPSPTPKPTAVGTLQPMSQEANIAAKHPTSVGGGALLEVSQGATVAITWICEIKILAVPCPSNVLSTWSGTASSGLSVAFDPITTTGAEPTTEYFTASDSTPPGLYSASSCLQSEESSSTTPSCFVFLIDVVSSTITPPAIPTAAPGQSVKLQIGPAALSSGGLKIPGQGHLYVELYSNGIAISTLEAGPFLAQNGDLDLFVQFYTEFPYTDPGVDISTAVAQSSLVTAYINYLGYQGNGDVPQYLPNMNSNTWADGLLLAQGVSQTTINGWASTLQNASGLATTGFSNGSAAEPCFFPVGRIALAQPLTMTNFGGCTNPPQI